MKKITKKEFKIVFTPEDILRKDFLSEYLDCYHDPYFEVILKKLIMGEPLTIIEIDQVNELREKVDLDVMYIDGLLDELQTPQERNNKQNEGWDDLSQRITFIMNRGKLSGWDYKFIYGEDGNSLLEQYKRRKYLSIKQLKQLERIEKNL